MRAANLAWVVLAAGMVLLSPNEPRADPPGHITGVGGVFFKSKDPKALAACYRDVLGLHVESWGGAMLRYDAPGHPSMVVWNAFPQATDYMAPSPREFMLNFAVDDLDAIVARLKAKGVAILKQDDTDPNGRFAWILDPDGTKIELWEPKAKWGARGSRLPKPAECRDPDRKMRGLAGGPWPTGGQPHR